MKRPVLCAILIYVALDLSLPMMPGAFVFEPADSVESLQTARARAAADVMPPVPARNAFVLLQLHVVFKDRLASRSGVHDHGHVVVNRLPRSLADNGPSRPSVDPH